MKLRVTKPTRVANFWGATQVVNIYQMMQPLLKGSCILVVPPDQGGTVIQYNAHCVEVNLEDTGNWERVLQPGVYVRDQCEFGGGGWKMVREIVPWGRVYQLAKL